MTALVDATEMNGLGGEWKTTVTVGNPIDLKTRFFQPLTYRSHLFLSPYAGLEAGDGRGLRRTRTRSAPTRCRAAPSAWTSATTSGPGASCASATPAPTARAAARSATPTLPGPRLGRGRADGPHGGRPDRQRQPAALGILRRSPPFSRNREGLGATTSYDSSSAQPSAYRPSAAGPAWRRRKGGPASAPRFRFMTNTNWEASFVSRAARSISSTETPTPLARYSFTTG